MFAYLYTPFEKSPGRGQMHLKGQGKGVHFIQQNIPIFYHPEIYS